MNLLKYKRYLSTYFRGVDKSVNIELYFGVLGFFNTNKIRYKNLNFSVTNHGSYSYYVLDSLNNLVFLKTILLIFEILKLFKDYIKKIFIGNVTVQLNISKGLMVTVPQDEFIRFNKNICCFLGIKKNKTKKVIIKFNFVIRFIDLTYAIIDISKIMLKVRFIKNRFGTLIYCLFIIRHTRRLLDYYLTKNTLSRFCKENQIKYCVCSDDWNSFQNGAYYAAKKTNCKVISTYHGVNNYVPKMNGHYGDYVFCLSLKIKKITEKYYPGIKTLINTNDSAMYGLSNQKYYELQTNKKFPNICVALPGNVWAKTSIYDNNVIIETVNNILENIGVNASTVIKNHPNWPIIDYDDFKNNKIINCRFSESDWMMFDLVIVPSLPSSVQQQMELFGVPCLFIKDLNTSLFEIDYELVNNNCNFINVIDVKNNNVKLISHARSFNM